MSDRTTVLIISTLNHFNNSNVIRDYTMRREDAVRAIKSFKNSYNNENKKNKLKLFWILVNYKQMKIIRPSKDRNIIIFNKNRYDKIISNPDGQLNDIQNTVVYNQYKSIENQIKTTEKKLKTLKCYICMRNFANEHNYTLHMNSKFHADLKMFTKKDDKGGQLKFEIILSGNPTSKSVIPLKRNRFPSIKLRLTNSSNVSYKILYVKTLLNVLRVESITYPFTLEAKVYDDIDTKLVVPDDVVSIREIIGYSYTDTNGKTFTSSKTLSFVLNDDFYDEFHPIIEYKRKQKTLIKELDREIVKGIPLKYKDDAPRPKKKLLKYELPVTLNKIFNSGFKKYDGMPQNVEDQLMQIKKLFNVNDHKNCLTTKNYTELLNIMLYLEEHQMNLDIRGYDMVTKQLVKKPNIFQLTVPGLAERRPSIIRGDSIFISEENKTDKAYEGIVNKIEETHVDLGLHIDFQKIYIPNKNFSVSFSFCRLPLRVEHQGISVIEHSQLTRIFPNPRVINNQYRTKELNLFNRAIGNNPEQLQAVQCIIQNTSEMYPYLIFGPPGTGKTSTLVETVKQLHCNKMLKILVCASSNDAVNTITYKLIENEAPVLRANLLRYISYSYNMKNVRESLYQYANVKNNEFSHITFEDIMKRSIVTTTLINAARIYNLGGNKCFDYVFIDEAGHSTETESFIPISCLLKRDGHIILTGDHEQLGPIIHSPIAREYGFGISMLERLMKFDLYKKNDAGKYNRCYVTKLLYNYRSHPAILEIPNRLFYNGDLVPKGNGLVNLAVGGEYEALKNKDFPVLFHNVIGKDMRENVSPSYFNINEMEIVDKYLQSLYGNKLCGRKITGNDIGIITPYRRQVQKLESMCKKRGYKDITVGSVEQFQGQEKLIIIISTVRSQSGLLEFDHKFHLGFVSNKKRFNVALTRAKALLIVIGNGELLQLDPRFYEFIKYCKENNSLYGQDLFIRDPPEEYVETNLLNVFEDEITPNHVDNINIGRDDI